MLGLRASIGRSVSWSSYWTERLVSVTNTLNPSKDTDIRSGAPTTNYGTNDTINIGDYYGNHCRCLMGFNFSELPKEISGLTNVKLRIYLSGEYVTYPANIMVYALKRDWGETTATWNKYDGVNNWSTAGALGVDDYNSTLLGTLPISATESVGWREIILNINSISEIQYGLLLKTDNENEDDILIRAKQVVTYKEQLVIEQLTFPPFEKYVSNPLFDGLYGSVVYNSGNLVFYYSNNINVYKRTSTDGLTWSDATQVMTPESGGTIDVTTAWKENSTWYMLYRSTEWGDHSLKSIGLATSADGNTWTKSGSNPVITHTDIGAWATGWIDPWGIIKIGATYYLWINDVAETPRQTGLATSTDLISWTMDANNPIFTGNRYCASPIKYKGYYYLFVSFGLAGYYGKIELYRDSDPRFLLSSREYLGVVYEVSAGEWDSLYLDTPSIITLDVTRSSFRNSKIEMYLCNEAADTVWRQGYSSQLRNILDFIP